MDMLDITVDRRNKRIIMGHHGLTIQLDSISNTLQRLQHPPMSVLATNSGCNLAYITLRNLGYKVSNWFSVEIDEKLPQCQQPDHPL